MLRCLLIVSLLGAGCHALPLPSLPISDESAQELWEKGQEAMREGKSEAAIQLYEKSLSKDANSSRNHMSLAAAHLSRGNDEAACLHLAHYLEAQPDAGTARFYYAEVLLRRGQHGPARAQFEQVVAQAQDGATQDFEHLLHCHGRLSDIAETEDDPYAQHLHRGIGLYLLACGLPSMGIDSEVLSSEALLCKAAGELTLARALRPTEARPSWYLHGVWHRLGQSGQAERWLQETSRAAATSYLSPVEHRSLQLAERCREERLRR